MLWGVWAGEFVFPRGTTVYQEYWLLTWSVAYVNRLVRNLPREAAKIGLPGSLKVFNVF